MRLKDANYKSHWNVLVFCDLWKMMSDLNMSLEKMPYFVSFALFGLTLTMKLKNLDFESHWITLIFFLIKKMMSDLNIVLSNIVWFGLSFLVAAEFGKRLRNMDFELFNIFQLRNVLSDQNFFPVFCLICIFFCFFFWHYCRNSFKLKMFQMILI